MLTDYSFSPAMKSGYRRAGRSERIVRPAWPGQDALPPPPTHGNLRKQPRQSIEDDFLDASSAAVTGDRFALSRSPSAEPGTDKIAAAACEAISVSSSSKRWSRGAEFLALHQAFTFRSGSAQNSHYPEVDVKDCRRDLRSRQQARCFL